MTEEGPFEFRFMDAENILEISVEGIYEPGFSTAYPEKYKLMLDSYNTTKCIMDFRKAEIHSPTMNTIVRTETLGQKYDLSKYTFALVVKEVTEKVEFLVASYAIIGLKIKLFNDYDIALKWLKEG